MRMEDDIWIRGQSAQPAHSPLLARLNCFLTRFLTSKRRRAWVRESNERSAHAREEFTGFDAIHFHVGPGDIGVGADVYLTSLDGAANELRRMCARGIDNGFDFMSNKRAQILQARCENHDDNVVCAREQACGEGECRRNNVPLQRQRSSPDEGRECRVDTGYMFALGIDRLIDY